MAKRYHQSKRDRMDERRGMERRAESERMYGAGASKGRSEDREYAMEHRMHSPRGTEYEGRERSERGAHGHQSNMINDDWGAPALLPRHVIDKAYPERGHYMGYGMPDLYTGVEQQINEDGMELGHINKPKKY